MESTRRGLETRQAAAGFSGLLPGGALKPGSVYTVDGSVSLVLALLAGPSLAGSWCGVIGLPDLGPEAAASLGIDLARLVLVPTPGDQWLTVTAALADVLPVVAVRPTRRVSATEASRLGARLRQRGCTLLVAGDWPLAEARLALRTNTWSGLGFGHGHLTGREVLVAASVRSGSSRTARMSLGGRPPEAPASQTADLDLTLSAQRYSEAV
ncbi:MULTISPECIES: hypothetical protein [unclassified Cryobacterium]|uniref:hypothetical protein n=1 Tax=unclassified Cryobacterium TaxID=2649013 RepID=UPI002AB50687|nr:MULTISPECIES: hypothetical protein [unclassified Cryobacterium]MDY7543931.1 hypothetical protein [Cryobacterium sp. 5B3]MEA9997662.1 hypothetical protein [Cryobacterium sp. RTS3]MEB0264518.1 hypothetical protein [Cryobacterium sp. 10I5]MEB0273643.1 hypothetical protein [Cryobacterium sp. 5B3]